MEVNPNGFFECMEDCSEQSLVRTEGKYQYVTLPTGSAACRKLMQTFCIDEEEKRVAALPSVDIVVRMEQHMDIGGFLVMMLRKDAYFHAILIQSRGRDVPHACSSKCARSSAPFASCRWVPDFQGGSCGSCVWYSRKPEGALFYRL